jgi:hypothetical protein
MSEPAHPGHRRTGPAAHGGRRFWYVLVATIAVAAALLRLADHVPGWVRGEPRGIARYASLDALERQLGTRVLVPTYFPDVLAWPPARVALSAGEGQPTLVALRDRRTGTERILIAQSIRGDYPIPSRLLPAGTVVEAMSMDIGGHPARLERARADDGAEWTDLSFVLEGRRVVIRAIGGAPPPDLERLARSLHRRRL